MREHERDDLLPDTVLVDLELVHRQIRHERVGVRVTDDDVGRDEIDGDAERRLRRLLLLGGRWNRLGGCARLAQRQEASGRQERKGSRHQGRAGNSHGMEYIRTHNNYPCVLLWARTMPGST